MKKIIFLLTLCGTLFLHGQSIERQVIGSTVNLYSGGTLAMGYTVGEAVIGTLANSGITLTQGFHQTANTGFGVADMNLDFLITVYPNPTASLLNVRFNNISRQEKYLLSIVSLTGTTVAELQFTADVGLEQIATFNLSGLAAASYVLRILDVKTGKSKNLIFDKTN